MSNIKTLTKVIENCPAGQIPAEIFVSPEPIILKGIVSDWKLVKLGLQSPQASIDYLKQHYNGRPSFGYFGSSSLKGRFFYDEHVTRLNYENKQIRIDEFLDLILATIDDPLPPSLYIASNLIDSHFPQLRADNDIVIPRPDSTTPVESIRAGIWIGNRTTACCHYDMSDNLACCVVGKRRFTLFPPEQIANLYPGPLDITPGGQALSMVDFAEPDLNLYPNFPEALAHGQIAELEAGDALYLPSMWWHQVEGLSPFNILINYWWSEAPQYTGTAMNVLYHAMLSLRDKPEHEKQAWRHVFDYYIFGDGQQAAQHLPEHAQGHLGKLDPMKARTLRAMLLNKLNR
ncbi:cupin-like domain-containing protein [Paraglaciecola hydrolytica]|uniref:Cupin n=1 Tax=Paraglaciecola hydrolytica TaxID=1799789 RepID=A0A136A674_9ALTE|nr:cupin-like domain-containing protein [Paraglaciecola hydrolytica]KXI30729.1 cupin [Paraglaciecola hydrolytica]